MIKFQNIFSKKAVNQYTISGYMDVCVCTIFDGNKFYLGFSSAWEVPKEILNYIIKENLDMNKASLKANFTKKDKVGYKEGLIGIVTKGRLNRKDYTKEAIRTALINIDNLSFEL